jgi:hypothetical protein
MKLIDAHIYFSDAEYAKHTNELVADSAGADIVALVSNSLTSKQALKA